MRLLRGRAARFKIQPRRPIEERTCSGGGAGRPAEAGGDWCDGLPFKSVSRGPLGGGVCHGSQQARHGAGRGAAAPPPPPTMAWWDPEIRGSSPGSPALHGGDGVTSTGTLGLAAHPAPGPLPASSARSQGCGSPPMACRPPTHTPDTGVALSHRVGGVSGLGGRVYPGLAMQLL